MGLGRFDPRSEGHVSTTYHECHTTFRLAIPTDLARHVLWLLWQCIRLPLFLFLATLEPIVSFVLSVLALLGLLTALLWEALHPAHFPFALMLGLSLGFALMNFAYHAVLRFLSR
jgi:hypothetical protein